MNIERRLVTSLKPAGYNPRKDLRPGDLEYEQIKRSIETFGYVDPIIANADGTVIGGHQRLKVLIDLGYQDVECVLVDLDKEQEKALNVALNKISGQWDESQLAELLCELHVSDLDATLTGFTLEELEALLKPTPAGELQEDDFDVSEAEQSITEPITRTGDLWLLGSHRLLCGDATKSEDYDRLMDGHLADIIFTDPPYNVAYEGGTKDALTILNDNMSGSAFYAFLRAFYDAAYGVTKPGGAIYVCHADSEGVNFRGAMQDAGWLLKQCLIWVKNALVLGRQDYHWRHEPILYGWKGGASHHWYGGRKHDTVIDESFGVTIQDGPVKQIHITNGLNALVLEVPSYEVKFAGNDETTSIWRVERPTKNKEHPTMKPVAIPGRAIQNSSLAGEIVLDPFGGSGSTLIACEQTGRKAYLMELDPKYCDVIVQRWEALTGGRAQKAGEPHGQTSGGVSK